MSLVEDFNKSGRWQADAGFSTTYSKSHLLCMAYNDSGYTMRITYDFLRRVMTTRCHEDGLSVIPFSQLDPETLEVMHAQLKKMKGNDVPPLPAAEKGPYHNIRSKSGL